MRTDLDFVLTASDVGALLKRLGYPDAVRAGTASMKGKLGWQGAPTGLDYDTLNGQFTLLAESGQFRKLNPGVGRLLGVLNLQSLPRRITLDFRDVFSEGFAFDRISGSIDVEKGGVCAPILWRSAGRRRAYSCVARSSCPRRRRI